MSAGERLMAALALMLLGGWLLSREVGTPLQHHTDPQAQLTMYSLTTCGYCKQKRQQFQQEGIRFNEFFVDVDAVRLEELKTKLSRLGRRPDSYGTPIIEVGDTLYLNNPSMATIRQALSEQGGVGPAPLTAEPAG